MHTAGSYALHTQMFLERTPPFTHRYGIQMRVHNRYRQAQSSGAT